MSLKIANLLKLDARWYVVIMLSGIAALSARACAGIVLRYVISTCLISCVLDFLIICLRKRRPAFPLSALVSGLIISGVSEPSHLFYLTPIAAILSKHIIKVSKRHIFNPAAFGLLVANIFWGLPLSWRVEADRAIIVAFGLFLAYRIKKLSLIFSFAFTTFILSLAYSLLIHQPVLSNLGILNLFFIFFMLPEPKTSPVYLKSKLIYGAVVSLLVILCMAILPRYDFMILGLILGNIAGVFLRKAR